MRRLTKDVPQWYDVTITETLQLTVRVEAHSPVEAEQHEAQDLLSAGEAINLTEIPWGASGSPGWVTSRSGGQPCFMY